LAIWWTTKGTPATGNRCLGLYVVNGSSRLPSPPATMTASTSSSNHAFSLPPHLREYGCHSRGVDDGFPQFAGKLGRDEAKPPLDRVADVTADSTILDAVARALRYDPGRPVVTYYDDATGERVELSLATFDNWVSKIANLCSLELMLDPGDLVTVELPTHWQRSVAMVGAWAAGLTVQRDPTTAVELRVVGPEGVVTHSGDAQADHVVACSLRPLGGRLVDPLPAGWIDFALEVPPQPDALMSTTRPTSSDVAVRGDEDVTHADLLQRGSDAAAGLGLEPGGRLVTDLDAADRDWMSHALVAPLAVGASVVLVAPTTAERRTAIAAQEMATVELWA
jgi:uncharacterized protein (TIGR03089 family)